MKKCYIAGKIGNLPPDEYLQLFAEAMEEVSALGMEPVNPCSLPHEHDKTWQSYMRHCIAALVTCEAIYVLNNWTSSVGAGIELQLANNLGFQIIFQDFKP